MRVSDPDLLFVYGTLRRGCDGAEARILHAQAEWLGKARLLGRLYRVDWYPALVMDAEATSWVIGDLFRMTDPDMTLVWLDRYEECGPSFPEPQEYRRMIMEVEGVDGSGAVRAWVYVYVRDREGLPWIEGGDWLNN